MGNYYPFEFPHYAPGRSSFPVKCVKCGNGIKPNEWFIVESKKSDVGGNYCLECAKEFLSIRIIKGRPVIYGRD